MIEINTQHNLKRTYLFLCLFLQLKKENKILISKKKSEDAFLYLFQDPKPKRRRLQYDRANLQQAFDATARGLSVFQSQLLETGQGEISHWTQK